MWPCEFNFQVPEAATYEALPERTEFAIDAGDNTFVVAYEDRTFIVPAER